MIAQKEIFIPTVSTVPVFEYDATNTFTTDYIEFPNSMKDWSLQTIFSIAPGAGAELNIEVSNNAVNYVPFSTATTAIDLTIIGNHIIYNIIMPVRYMRIKYVPGATLGEISLIISK
jgi:hypothetical protein